MKSATVSRLINSERFNDLEEVIVHTGQHYDHNMSQQFFNELDIPEPVYNLSVGSGSHGQQTGAIMLALEGVVATEHPDWILVYGDTNSTLAGALVAAKIPCRLAHVEAGLRSFRWGMPEEVNRIVTDRLSDLLFCPTEVARGNLLLEGRESDVHVTGDVMYDSFLYYKDKVNHEERIRRLELSPGQFILVTIHRAENTDDLERLTKILSVLQHLSAEIEVVLPLHPRTRKKIEASLLSFDGIRVIDPVPYLTMISLLLSAKMVITDSGGLQKEAYFAQVPCVTLRDETEWIETVKNGWNRLASPDDKGDMIKVIETSLELDMTRFECPECYGTGDAANKILNILMAFA